MCYVALIGVQPQKDLDTKRSIFVTDKYFILNYFSISKTRSVLEIRKLEKTVINASILTLFYHLFLFRLARPMKAHLVGFTVLSEMAGKSTAI